MVHPVGRFGEIGVNFEGQLSEKPTVEGGGKTYMTSRHAWREGQARSQRSHWIGSLLEQAFRPALHKDPRPIMASYTTLVGVR
jgi:hypothetical protein